MIFTREQILSDVKKLLDKQKEELKKKIHLYDREDMRDWVYSENDLVVEYLNTLKNLGFQTDQETYYDLRDLQIFMLEEIEELREG